MGHNYCLKENYALIPTQMHQLLVCSVVYMHIDICLRSWQLKQLPKLFELFVKQNSNTFLLTLNNFPKSRLFANINVFELFDLPKSRLKHA